MYKISIEKRSTCLKKQALFCVPNNDTVWGLYNFLVWLFLSDVLLSYIFTGHIHHACKLQKNYIKNSRDSLMADFYEKASETSGTLRDGNCLEELNDS